MKKLTNNIWYMDYDDYRERPIIGFIKGKYKNILIDSGNSKEHTEEILYKLSKIGVNKIDYIVITHWHWDHTYGLSYLDGIKMGSNTTNKQLKRLKEIAELENKKLFIDEKNTFSNLEKLYKDNRSIETLNLYFDKKMFLDLGDLEIELNSVGGDHSEDSSLIYIKKDKVAFLGDLTYRGFWNGKRYNSIENLEKIYKELFSYDCETYITSHKKIYTREELKKEIEDMIEIGNGVMNTEDGKKLRELELKNKFIYDTFKVWKEIKQNKEELK